MLGLMLVAGGKYTTYRVMAADVVDRAARRLGGLHASVPASRTADLPLLGADGYRAAWASRAETARRHGVPVGVVEHLLERYGSLASAVLSIADDDPALARPLAGAPEYLGAEVVYAVRAEGARSLDDILSRRLRVSIETTHRGAESARHAAALAAAELGWTRDEQCAAVEDYVARVEGERRSQKMPDDESAVKSLF
jgi:glycerol-3-phosphate dehydrogenase